MYPLQREKIADGVFFNSILDSRFKTNRISVHLFLKLDPTHATEYAILPFLLRKGYANCPDMTQLNRKLMSLYGAFLNADVLKIGDNQVLNLAISCLDDAYALNQEALTQQATDILCNILLHPIFENGCFRKQDVEVEKQNLIDLIESEINDKRSYAINRLTRLMCQEEPYGCNKYGDSDSAAALTPEQVTEAYHRAISSAGIQIMYVGSDGAEIAKQQFSKAFSSIARNQVYSIENFVRKEVRATQEVTEQLQVAQSKMVLGFRTGTEPSSPDVAAMRLMIALYGGTATSKLFLNVREKLSLCYYCASRFDRFKGIMLVDSGVEHQNIEKAKKEILTQLDEIKNGNISDEEMEYTKLSLINSMKTVGDSPNNVEIWYLSQICYRTECTPQDEIESLQYLTKEDVIRAANQVALDTVYLLTGKEEDSHAE